MKHKTRSALLVESGLLGLVGVLGACGIGDAAPQTSATNMTSSANDSTSVAATLAEFEKQPERIVRVIVTVKPGADAQKRVAAAARSAGATSVSTIDGQPMVVIEGKPAHLRAAIATGQVVQIQRDSPAPTN
jgi:chorismate mutase